MTVLDRYVLDRRFLKGGIRYLYKGHEGWDQQLNADLFQFSVTLAWWSSGPGFNPQWGNFFILIFSNNPGKILPGFGRKE